MNSLEPDGPVCPLGCAGWDDCCQPHPNDCAASNREDEPHGDRYGFGVCRTGRCIEPCGQHGGCAR